MGPSLGATRILLACGPLSVLVAVASHVIVPLRDPTYRVAAQTVSELSAIGAPTRRLWWLLGTVSALLTFAFGAGVRASAGSERRLRATGTLIATQALLSVFWPPMHPRGTVFTFTDTLHIVWAAATVLLLTSAMALSAAALRRAFRRFSFSMLATLLGAGGMTSLDAPRVAAGLPTPWVGVWERIGMGAHLLWMLALAIALLRTIRGANR